jgi:ABC-2 type transport system ATP-binding protein
MIEATDLTKRYGRTTAVDGISFRVEPGVVTGFLGPNGAGKSTTMRMMVGLESPTSGTVTIGGRRAADLAAPLHEVGVLLDAKAVHPTRSARDHLRSVAATHRIGRRRVEEVLELTGLAAVANRKAGQFSLGMGQRLGIATALLGDPATVVLDEPVNGLDPEGVVWVRTLMRSLAAEGRAVLLSSHLMEEMTQTADRVIVLGRGRIIADDAIAAVIARAGGSVTRVRADDPRLLADLAARCSWDLTWTTQDAAEIDGVETDLVARTAGAAGVVLLEVAPVAASLERAFFALTHDAVEYRAGH